MYVRITLRLRVVVCVVMAATQANTQKAGAWDECRGCGWV